MDVNSNTNSTQVETQPLPKRSTKRMPVEKNAKRLVKEINNFLRLSGRPSMNTKGARTAFAQYALTVKWLIPYAAPGSTWYFRCYTAKRCVALEQATRRSVKPASIKTVAKKDTSKPTPQTEPAVVVTREELDRVRLALDIAQKAWQRKITLDDKKVYQLALLICGRGIADLLHDVILTA